jgi:hypothetical protein
VAQAHDILTRGMATSFRVAAAFDLAALLIVALIIKIRPPAPAPVAAPARPARGDEDEEAEAILADIGDPI